MFKLAIVAVLAMGIAACEQEDTGTKQTIGTLLGAAGGAVAGAQFGKGRGQLVGVAVGTVLGGLIGSQIGKSLDRADKLAMERSTQSALETGRSGETVTWRNPDSGHAGTVTPQPAYKTQSDQYCREYQQTVTIGGKTETAYGTACRQPDGSWKLVES